ncbi:MAG: aldo/keto reductase [Clostridiales Family XIII bacterium]|jgi:predicted aldo/keto reductase-like oxidoreductase|nr:aldo/keto reductase [Clostridiales Family XIII bacterium]
MIDFGKPLGMGCLRLPLFDEKEPENIDMEKAKKHIDIFQENGYKYYDTSYVYHKGNSEKALGTLLVDRYPRDAYLISTKMPIKWMTKPEQMELHFQEQLDRLHLDCIDFYLVHMMERETYTRCEKWGAIEFLKQKRAEGKFKEFGVSVHDTPEFLEEVLTTHPEIDFVMLQINYVDWVNPSIRAGESYKVALKFGKPIVVMEPCKGGTLASLPEKASALMKAYNPDASEASWAYRFVATLPGVRMTLAGMPDTKFLEDNLKTFDDLKPLNEAELKIIDQVIEIINENTVIPCTGCNYCTENGCPQNIPIADNFGLINDMKRFENSSNAGNINRVNIQADYYESWVKNGAGPASSCIACKKCERICPQNLPIVSYLAEYVVPLLENWQHKA